MACRWLIWALLNYWNAKWLFSKLNRNVFDGKLSLWYENKKLTFDRQLVFRDIRTQFPLWQVYPTWNCHLLRSIHSLHTTQPARIHPSISKSLQELCWPRQWCTHQYHRRHVGFGQEEVEMDVWYPVWIHTQLLGWVHLVPELRKRPNILAVAERHHWTVPTAVKLQSKIAPLGATTY